MGDGAFERVLLDWIAEHWPAPLPGASPPAQLAVLGPRDGATASDDVLKAWRRSVVRSRRLVDQAEGALFDLLLAQGRSWEEIAGVLALPDGQAARDRHDRVKTDLRDTHPSVAPEPWR
ncbi:hypothetical protein [Saccharothrix syringae]|uniref:Uncharacterized protein n=1 Tax=Saccharothrix syringae TaxID=103733 RepID=A0A5Q0HBK7_SACSY|nr:hypothetical protein [Saccharothrix syringae]QFZ23571.1 hypothetical protein EKG83_44520 [Saccharothrix syringae]